MKKVIKDEVIDTKVDIGDEVINKHLLMKKKKSWNILKLLRASLII